MPKLSEKQMLISFIQNQIFILELIKSTSNQDDINFLKIEEKLSDLSELLFGLQVRFLNQKIRIPKSSNFGELLWYLPPNDFKQELRVSFETFSYIHGLIVSHPVFHNLSPNEQAPVEIQMAVAFDR
jgi:hypothetical protein